MVAGIDAQNFGEGKNSWLTGCAAWTFVNASQFILGITPTLEGMRVKPCLPKEIGSFSAVRKIGTTTLHISGKRGEEYSLKKNGEVVEGEIIPLNGEKDIDVEVIYL